MECYIDCASHTALFQFFPFFFRSSMKGKLGYRVLKSWCLNLLLYATDSLGEARDKEGLLTRFAKEEDWLGEHTRLILAAVPANAMTDGTFFRQMIVSCSLSW